jgi:flagellar biogenesis protein FliO
MPSYTSYLLETIVTLALVCACAFAVLYAARRLGLGRASGPITLVGQLPLDARRSVYLIKIAEKVLVVGTAEGGMVKLGELDANEVPTPAAVPVRSFAEVLAGLRGEKS